MLIASLQLVSLLAFGRIWGWPYPVILVVVWFLMPSARKHGVKYAWFQVILANIVVAVGIYAVYLAWGQIFAAVLAIGLIIHLAQISGMFRN